VEPAGGQPAIERCINERRVVGRIEDLSRDRDCRLTRDKLRLGEYRLRVTADVVED